MTVAGSDALWERLRGALDPPEAERFRTNPDRVRNRAELVALLSGRLRTRTSADWEAKLTAAGVPASPVRDVGEALAHAQTHALGILEQRGRRGDADRVGEHDLGAAGEARGELRDDGWIDAAVEGAADRDGDRHRRRLRRNCEDRVDAGDGFLERRVPVRAVEALRRRKRDIDAVETGRAEALVPALVQDEPRVLRSRAALECCDDLFRSRHLRHTVVADEADRLDARESRTREAVDQLGAHAGRERLRLVLETVSRPDVAQDHTSITADWAGSPLRSEPLRRARARPCRTSSRSGRSP